MSKKMRHEIQCQNCAAYWINWSDEIEEEMAEAAPGEECSQGMNIELTTKCSGWTGCDED